MKATRLFIIFVFFSHLSIVASAQVSVAAVLFDHDEYILKPHTVKTLDSLFILLKDDSLYKISIQGFTDISGTDQHNSLLAQKRATAVQDYFLKKGIAPTTFDVINNGNNELFRNLPAAFQRRSTIRILREERSYSFYGEKGTEVITEVNNPISITEYFGAEDMLRDTMFALDLDDRPLITDGMIRICSYGQQKDVSGKFYLIKIPIKDLKRASNMKVWAAQIQEGQKRWQETNYEIEVDPVKKVLVLKYPIPNTRGSAGCIFINADQRCEGPCFVYITFWKPFPFKVIDISHGRFSAKTNDSTYVFSKDDISLAKGNSWSFRGVSDSAAVVDANLDSSVYSTDSKGNEHFFVCDTCLMRKSLTDILPVLSAPPAPNKIKRRNFFQRIVDFFTGK